jgi:hypothetical protein
VFEEDLIAEGIRISEQGGPSGVVRDRGLSEDEEYNSEELDSGCDTEDEGPRVKFPTFKLLDNMRDYKWELGTYFVSKKAFQEAIRTYDIHSGRDLKFKKNDKRRVRVICKGSKGNCRFEAYCAKLPNEETWQLRKIQRFHKCSRVFKLKMLNSDWLGSKLHSRVRDDQSLKLTTIMNRTEQLRSGVWRSI